MQNTLTKHTEPILDLVREAVLLTDASGMLVHVNRAYHTLLGYSSSELIGNPVAVLMPGRGNTCATYPQEQESISPGFHVVRKDGKNFPTEMGTTKLLDGEGLVLKTVRERSAQGHAEALVVVGAKGTIELFNAQAERLSLPKAKARRMRRPRGVTFSVTLPPAKQ